RSLHPSTTVALTRLPTELLDNIITHALPEGFESVALTCKKIYVLCTPFIERHNRLRSQFHNLTYYEKMTDPSFTIRTAFDLIIRIAVEPVVARYVRDADFEVDSFFTLFTRGRTRELIADVHCAGAVVRLLANSPHLEQAGLDWKEYYAEIEEDLEAARYSQHAAAFLLTVLPNVETLTLPRLWKPLDATDKLIDAVVRKAKQSHLPCDRPSLAQVTRFGPSVSLGPEERFDLDWASPFLALPHMRSFRGPSCVAMDDGHKRVASKDPYGGFGQTLEAVHLVSCCIDEVGIADFLKHTTRLRTLRYSHSTKGNDDSQDWNICKFVTAIEREAGNHLVELSVTIREIRGSIAPGKASMRGFQRLRRLELPLEIALCNIAAATSQIATPKESLVRSSTDHELEYYESFIGDLVPASVSQLSLISRGTDHHEKALDLMFRHFAAKKDGQLPALKEIHLSCPVSADNAYKDQCARLLAETKKVGVVLHLEPWPSSVSMTWDGEQ
ncbi:hypothetical protein MMC22_011516, partial [Lobaria immixta]|nr:hypothetical protein [Lobaria immixta]